MKWVLALLVISLSAFAESKVSWQELRQQCEAQREELLAPERESAIAGCIERGNRTVAQCKQFYVNYGGGGVNAKGATRRPKYSKIPICVAASDAERAAKRSPRDPRPLASGNYERSE